MFVIGIVVAIDESSARVKLQIPEMDNFETGWFFVPQACTVGDKSHNLPKSKTLVSACCSEDLQDGCIIGALYNDEDTCILGGENFKYIFFEDGTKIQYDKLENKFLLDCVGDTQIESANNIKIKSSKLDIEAEEINLKATKTTIKSEIDIVGSIKQLGELIVTGGISATNAIKSLIDVIASKISLIGHIHGNGNSGADTTAPK